METKKVVVGGGGTHSFAVRLYLHYFQIMFKAYLFQKPYPGPVALEEQESASILQSWTGFVSGDFLKKNAFAVHQQPDFSIPLQPAFFESFSAPKCDLACPRPQNSCYSVIHLYGTARTPGWKIVSFSDAQWSCLCVLSAQMVVKLMAAINLPILHVYPNHSCYTCHLDFC